MKQAEFGTRRLEKTVIIYEKQVRIEKNKNLRL